MRSQKMVIVDIDQDGNCNIDGQGFVGPECGNFIEEIEESLGQRTSQINKPEYNQRRTISRRNYQVGGR